jgi:hypothetical protein
MLLLLLEFIVLLLAALFCPPFFDAVPDLFRPGESKLIPAE